MTKGIQKSMDYYLNEYSLRGQFKNIQDFFDSLRDNTLPVLNRIQKNQENIIWKKDTFWQSQICEGIFLNDIPHKRNERSVELVALKNQLIKLACENPFWESDAETDVEVKEYKFDEQYRNNFERTNCFTKAIESEGRVVSFAHSEYQIPELSIIVVLNDADVNCTIDNIYSLSWWKNEPEIKKWIISSKYRVEVRAREFAYHPPHFHVLYNDWAAVFRLSDGKLYRYGKKKWTSQMIAEVWDWYKKNKKELQEAWENLHSS